MDLGYDPDSQFLFLKSCVEINMLPAFISVCDIVFNGQSVQELVLIIKASSCTLYYVYAVGGRVQECKNPNL